MVGGGESGKRGEKGEGGRARRDDLKGLVGWIVRLEGILAECFLQDLLQR